MATLASLRRDQYGPDEDLLRRLKSDNPGADWEAIQTMFNNNVPSSRQRTLDGIKGKWKSMNNWKRGVTLLHELKHNYPYMKSPELLDAYNKRVTEHRRISLKRLEAMLKTLPQPHDRQDDEETAPTVVEKEKDGGYSPKPVCSGLSSPNGSSYSEACFPDEVELDDYLYSNDWVQSLRDLVTPSTSKHRDNMAPFAPGDFIPNTNHAGP